MIRHTKIVATAGPACLAPDALAALVAAGVDVFRLNFSHGTHDSHAQAFHGIQAAAAAARRHVAILQDLGGPKIRTGPLRDGRAVMLLAGGDLRIAAGDEAGDSSRVFTPYAPLIDSAHPGDRLLLDDGMIELRVTGRAAGELVTTVVNGGTLGEHKGINAPGVALPASANTSKDEDDLRFGIRLGVDLVALSFVQTPQDVLTARRIAKDAGRDLPLIAKIERPQALEHLDAILAAADGVMVARGDLGLESPLEQVPRIQKQIVLRARTHGKPVIVATQVLESMRTEPRPTRAEVSDAATAVDQGADAIMLSGETAAGAFPLRAVETLAAIICDAESATAPSQLAVLRAETEDDPAAGSPRDGFDTFHSLHGRAMCEAAVTLATTGQAAAIVAVTRFGKTAQLLSSLRPRATILAVTHTDAVARRLALFWGVRPLVSELDDLRALEPPLRAAATLPPRAVVVFINVSPDLSRPDANFLNVQRLES